MSIKSIIQKKKLEKSGSMMDIMLFNHVVEKVNGIIDTNIDDAIEKHTEFTLKTRSELESIALKHIQSLNTLVASLEKGLDNVSESNRKEMVAFLNDLKGEVDTYKQECVSYCDSYVNDFKARLESVLGNADRFKGKRGEPGPKGDAGSPDTPDEVVTKVNRAKKRIRMSSIEGLMERLDGIKSAIRGGKGGKSGGGMGNPEHETHSVGASTTTVTLAYPVGAGGRAIWVYYQGQFLVYGVHYTVNRNVITLTIDNKINSTYLDVTYIRGS